MVETGLRSRAQKTFGITGITKEIFEKPLIPVLYDNS